MTALLPPLAAGLLLAWAGAGCGDAAPATAMADAAVPPDLAPPGPPLVLLPKEALSADELGLLVNDDDPQSVEVAAHYQQARAIPAANVVHLKMGAGLPVTVSAAAFNGWKATIDKALPPGVQALAVSWLQPTVVVCDDASKLDPKPIMSLTSALAFGVDPKWCNAKKPGACVPTAASDYYASDSTAPYTDLQVRPAMVLAGTSAAAAIALIDRGVAADGTQPTGTGWLLRTSDSARSVRYSEFQSTLEAFADPAVLDLRYLDNSAFKAQDYLTGEKDVLFYFTGLADVPKIDTNAYRPGAIADHLTSWGGQIPTSYQMSILRWIEAGATASYGAVYEPCNFPAKFPDPSLAVPYYFRGATLVEAYWKSVAWPGEGLFIGEPLARPWPTTTSYQGGVLTIRTSALVPGRPYGIDAAPSKDGPWTVVQDGITSDHDQRLTLTVSPVTAPVYRLVAR